MGISGFWRAPSRDRAPTSTRDSFQVGQLPAHAGARTDAVVGVQAGRGPEAGVAVAGEGQLVAGVLVGQDGVGRGLRPAPRSAPTVWARTPSPGPAPLFHPCRHVIVHGIVLLVSSVGTSGRRRPHARPVTGPPTAGRCRCRCPARCR